MGLPPSSVRNASTSAVLPICTILPPRISASRSQTSRTNSISWETTINVSSIYSRECSLLERYKCRSHCEFFWELQPDCIGEVVKYCAVGEKVVFLMEETDIRG